MPIVVPPAPTPGAADLAAKPILINAAIGKVRLAYPEGTLVEFAYTAGLPAVPDEAIDAALVFISYKYRRNHGGSATYMPAGADASIAPPMGVAALKEQMRLALGSYAKGGNFG